nr:hypothetical protein [Tanacetum cinerariifolium]
MNTKFVNNLPPYWEKYVTNVKNNKDISSKTYVKHYTYLKSYEPHALKTLKKQEQSSRIVDPLAKSLGNVGNTGTRGTQSYGQVTDNKEKLVICYNCRGEGHVSRQCKEKKRVKDSQYFKGKMLLMEAKEKGAVLDAEAEAFLADVECYDQPPVITTTNIFEVSHEDAYDSDVDEGPHATVAFMANLSSTSGTNSATTSYVNKASSVSPDEIYMITILYDLRSQLDGHLKANQEQSMVNDSLRAELARSLVSSNPWYAKQAKISQPTLYDGHALLKPTNTPVRVHNSEESLVQAEINRTKMSNKPVTIKPINYAELNALYSHFVPQKELSREQVYWLLAEELATQKKLVQSLDENLVKEVTEFMRIFNKPDKEYEQCVLEKKKLQIEKKNLLIQNECLITNYIAKDICSIVLDSDRDRPLSEELSSNCVRENSKVIKLEAEILKQQQMLAELDKRFFEINQLKEQLQGKDDTIRKLQTQINSMGMLNVEPTVGVKPATGASKPMSKSDNQNHSTLPAKREKARRVEDHHRNLNKQNHVDSRLNLKRTGFVSNSNTVCNTCNESLFFANHDNCVVCNLKYVNVKTPMAKHNVKTTKKVWKAKVVTIRSQWKPTGRRFTLYDEYPFTRIVDPIVEPLEITPCVSSNSKVTMISRIRRQRYNLIPAESRFKTSCLIDKDKYMMKAQAHVLKSSAISNVQAIP